MCLEKLVPHGGITGLLETYRQSIEHAEDTTIAARIWIANESASLIFPLGRELGWPAIRDNFYGATMSGKFRDRKLLISGKPAI